MWGVRGGSESDEDVRSNHQHPASVSCCDLLVLASSCLDWQAES